METSEITDLSKPVHSALKFELVYSANSSLWLMHFNDSVTVFLQRKFSDFVGYKILFLLRLGCIFNC